MSERTNGEVVDALIRRVQRGTLREHDRAAVFARMVKPSAYARCTICSAPLDVPGRPWSRSCGGDCIACMADAGDPECVEAVAAMRAGEQTRTEIDKLSDPAAVYVNMLRGTIAKPFIESIVSLYGANALADALPSENGKNR